MLGLDDSGFAEDRDAVNRAVDALDPLPMRSENAVQRAVSAGAVNAAGAERDVHAKIGQAGDRADRVGMLEQANGFDTNGHILSECGRGKEPRGRRRLRISIFSSGGSLHSIGAISQGFRKESGGRSAKDEERSSLRLPAQAPPSWRWLAQNDVFR